MGSAKNDGAWDWRRLKDEDPAAKSTAWAHLIQTPWMARMIPHHHRTEVPVAGVAGWSRDGVSWSAVKLARTFQEKFIVFSALCFCFSCCLLLL